MSQKRKLQYPGETALPPVRMVERVEPPPLFEPPPVWPAEIESIAELEKLIKPMTVPPAPRKGEVPAELVPTLVQEIKNSEYKNIGFDTSVARVNEPLGLRDLGIVADSMTVIAIGGGFSYRINKPTNDLTIASVGLQETDFEIEELYITNPAAPGTATIRINWNPFLIRLKP